MAKKMPRRFVALSSSVIAAIYLTGLVYTRGADAALASAASGVASSPTTAASPRTSVGPPSAVVSASTSSTSASTPTAETYKDGAYTATGTSRRGNVSVSLTIQSGRIANVTIAGATTQYPVSRIAPLPAQVVSRQSGQVDNVSGATYSAEAFHLAVQAALIKASA